MLRIGQGVKRLRGHVVHARAPTACPRPHRCRFISTHPPYTVSSELKDRAPLLGIKGLYSPKDFESVSRETVAISQALEKQVIEGTPSKQLVELVDRISNQFCLALDGAELIRSVHPDSEWVEAADQAHNMLSNYVLNLNCSVDLYRAVKGIECNEELWKELDYQDKALISSLRKEFEQNGIHLPEETKRKLIEIQDDLNSLGASFLSNINSPSSSTAVFQTRELAGLPQEIMMTLRRFKDQTIIPVNGYYLAKVLKCVPNAKVRKEYFVKVNNSVNDNLHILEKIIQRRHDLATLLGSSSFAEYCMSNGRMVESLGEVEKYFDDLSVSLEAKAKEEYALLVKKKHSIEGGNEGLMDWDVSYYMGRTKSDMYSLDADQIAQYFSVGNCISGLKLVTERTFGIRLVEVPIDEGEAWAQDVSKLAFEHESEGILGYLYLDLYARPRKNVSAAVFAVRCGKLLPSGDYQLPVSALVCNFDHGGSKRNLLYHSDVEVLFHEFGHALHSILGHTKYQHLSGTRTSVDFVEAPSQLFEQFAWDPRVLKEFARHYKTGQPMPVNTIERLRRSKNMFAAMSSESQIFFSMLDLAFCKPPTGESSARVHGKLHNKYTRTPYTENTHFHTRFGHLVTYAASYYSYLFSAVFAANIWHKLFAEDPFSRESGEKYRRCILQHGAAKDPKQMIRDVLGEEPSIDWYTKDLGLTDDQGTPWER